MPPVPFLKTTLLLPKIYTRDYRKNEGIIEVDLRDVSETELEEIAQAIETLYGGLKK